jgi:hypothetical protein
MKKVILTVTSLFAIAVLLNACKKEQPTIADAKNPTATATNSTGMSKEDVEIENKIKAFAKKVENHKNNPTAREASDPYTVDEAEFFIETTLNYLYAVTDIKYENEHRDEITFEVEKDNDGSLDFDKVADAYIKAQTEISNYYASLSDDERTLVIADLEKVDNLSNADHITFKLSALFSTGIAAAINVNPFGYGWKWAFGMGSCNGGLGGRDACTELARQLNATISPISPPPLYEWYFTNIVSTGDIHPMDVSGVVTPPAGSLSYNYLYSQGDVPLSASSDQNCIPANYMNFYFNGGKSIALYFKPVGKEICNYFYHPDVIVSSNPNSGFHDELVKYGVRHMRLKKTNNIPI